MLDILICIESRIYREGLELLLSRRPDVSKVRAFDSRSAIGEMSAKRACDVILVDVSLGADGAAPSAQIGDAYNNANGVPIVALGFNEAESEVLDLIEAGATAFVSKGDSIDDLIGIVESAARGEARLSPHIVHMMQERLARMSCDRRAGSQGLNKLSPRERHILDLVGQRLSNKEIARTLGLEVSTIKNHVHNIIAKLGVKNRTQAAAMV